MDKMNEIDRVDKLDSLDSSDSLDGGQQRVDDSGFIQGEEEEREDEQRMDRGIESDSPNAPTPVILLSGFLGSGKTTLLGLMLEHYREQGLRPAVIMNELGDINLDGQLVDRNVPLAEMLSGCICCSMRGDLGLKLHGLITEHGPDVIMIESTGAANPMETIDGITDASMYKAVQLSAVVTVVDGPELLVRSKTGKGRTFKLLKEQIRCATTLLLNKKDKLAPEELVELQQMLREWNAHAAIIPTVRCESDSWSWLDEGVASVLIQGGKAESGGRSYEQPHDHSDEDSDESLHGHSDEDADRRPHSHSHLHSHDHSHNESHSHVMAFTHYWRHPVNSEAFEALLRSLPDNIYRAKGIVSFTDAPSRFLFQYAYRETDFIRIEPQGDVYDVAVFIGEHFDKQLLLSELERLEQMS